MGQVLELGAADLPAFRLLDLDSEGVVQALDLLEVLFGSVLELCGGVGVITDDPIEPVDLTHGLTIVALELSISLLTHPQLVPQFLGVST